MKRHRRGGLSQFQERLGDGSQLEELAERAWYQLERISPGNGGSGQRAATNGQSATAEAPVVRLAIDFGTAGARVILHHTRTGESYPVRHGTHLPGQEPYTIPAALQFAGGKLYFGAHVDQAATETIISSFKACLAAHAAGHQPAICGCNAWPKEYATGKRHPHQSYRPQITASLESATLFLAYVIHCAKLAAANRWGTSALRHLDYHMNYPGLQGNSHLIRHLFSRALFLATLLADIVEIGVEASLAHEAYQTLSREFPGDVSDGQHSVTVEDEATAAVLGVAGSSSTESRIIATANVGAGFAHFTFHALPQADGGAPQLLASTSVPLGLDALDAGVLEWIKARSETNGMLNGRHTGRMALQIRSMKHLISESQGLSVRVGDRNSGNLVMTAREFRRLVRSMGDNLLEHYTRTWEAAFSQGPSLVDWECYDLFLLGGFRRNSILASPFQWPVNEIVEEVRVRPLNLSDKLILTSPATSGGPAHQPAEDDLIIAYGLACEGIKAKG